MQIEITRRGAESAEGLALYHDFEDVGFTAESVGPGLTRIQTSTGKSGHHFVDLAQISEEQLVRLVESTVKS